MWRRGEMTRYELVAEHDGHKLLVCYSSRRSRAALWTILCKRAEALAAVCGTDKFTFAARVGDGGTMGEWQIYWSGRTQLEAQQHGKLLYIGDEYETLQQNKMS